ncbi:hypothetical protein I3J27_21545 [Bradyrhizobium xenonodulans]|uniref:Uncharacterized protein n=1 Tax=Bradyrhizobium xenonodulans TaxID=2736875 RepID=A0ABY7MBG0_9BRAD|nr:hypothetical protein [Bradyrhizobium xenonodulans]WBL75620.1 hypothetical protein I3J27_21545 [Bradyrhizobium xenonodulans]
MITISINVAVGASSIVMFAGFMLGYAIAWRQRRSGPRITFDPVNNALACDMPMTPDELDRLRDEVAMWSIKPTRVGQHL